MRISASHNKVVLKVIALLLVVWIAPVPAVHATRLYAIVMANTLDPDAGTAITKGRDIADRWVGAISRALQRRQIPTTYWRLDGQNFTTEDIRDVVNNQLNQVQSDDIIFFYYVGHGANNVGTPYPELSIPNRNGGGPGLSFGRIVDVLNAKGAQLTFTMAEACNSFPQFSLPTPPPPAQALDVTRAIVELFAQTKGSITITTASPGQHAHASDVMGGIFSTEFFRALRRELDDAVANNRQAQWANVLNSVNTSQWIGGEEQTPQIWVDGRRWP